VEEDEFKFDAENGTAGNAYTMHEVVTFTSIFTYLLNEISMIVLV